MRLPGRDRDIVTEGLVSAVSIRDGQVVFAITVDPRQARELEPVRREAERRVSALPGVKRAIVALTADAPAGRSAPAAAAPARPAASPPDSAAGPPSRA